MHVNCKVLLTIPWLEGNCINPLTDEGSWRPLVAIEMLLITL